MIDITFSFGAALEDCGKNFKELRMAYEEKALEAWKWINETEFDTSGHGWMALPEASLSEVYDNAAWLRGYDSIIQVGIGGSALGNLMLNQALLDDYYNETEDRPRFYLADNPDPDKAASILELVKNGRTALVGVSKSGATAETMTQFLWFREQLRKTGGSDSDILVITDPEKGIFRAFAQAVNCRVMTLPQSVGGRYSVLCPAGLTTAASLGIDVAALLRGAAAMKQLLSGEKDFVENPALQLAALQLENEASGHPMSVLMPYSSKLAYFAEWYAQLWAESLGKEGKGTTPVRALGAIDQHSQVQLYTSGPKDKLFTLISVKDHGKKITVPHAEEEALLPLDYLSGQELGEMLNLEARSTAAALVKRGAPLVWLEARRIDAENIGALVFFYEYLTALTGHMMGIDPFDQPGVEQGKKYTYGLMGRKGFEKDAEEVKEWFSRIKSKTIAPKYKEEC